MTGVLIRQLEVGLMGRYGNPNTAIRKLLLAWNSGKVEKSPNGNDPRNLQN